MKFFTTISLFSLLILAILSSSVIPVFGQNYPYRLYTMEDGLPNLQALNIYEDKNGKIWISTQLGLVVFDGFTFENFSEKADIGNSIHEILENDEGIWVFTNKNIVHFKDYKFIAKYPTPPQTYASKILSEDKKTILFHNLDTTKTACTFDTKTKQYITKILRSEEYFKIRGYSNFFLLKEAVYLSSPTHWTYNTNIKEKVREYWKEKYKNFPYQELANYQVEKELKYDYEIRISDTHTFHNQNNVVFTGSKAIYHIDLEKNTYKKWLLDKEITINGVLLDKHKNIWLATEQGVYKFYAENGMYYDDNQSLPANTWAVQEDYKGNYLIGSYKTGYLYELNKQTNNFQKLDLNYKGFNDYVHPIYYEPSKTKNNELVFGTGGGVYLYKDRKLQILDDSTSFEYSTAYFITYSDTVLDDIALGGVDRFLLYDKYRNLKASFTSEDLKRQGNIQDSSYQCNILAIEQIDKDTYFLGVSDGFLHYHVPTKKITYRYLYDSENADSAKVTPTYPNFKQVRVNKKDKYGTIWCGAYGNKEGLYMYNPKTKEVKKVASEFFDGEIIKTILPINNGEILLVSSQKFLLAIHLERFYKQEGNYYYMFDKSNGFDLVEPTQNSLMQDSKGNILFMTASDRLYSFKTDTSIFDLPKLTISKSNIEFFDNQTREWQHVDMQFSDTLRFNKKMRSLRFEMQPVTQKMPEDLIFVYRVKQDGEWTEWKETTSSFILADFPAGKSILEVATYYYFDSEKLG